MMTVLTERKHPSSQVARTALFLVTAAAVIGLATFVSQHFWRENGLHTLQAITESRIELIASAVRAEINRQDHLPIVLALDADVRRALTNPQDRAQLEQINHKLQRNIPEADSRPLHVTGRDGVVLAAASSKPDEVIVGRDLKDRSYFLKALESGRTTYRGVDPVSKRVRYSITEAIKAGS